MSDLQDRVQETIDRLVESGVERGVQVAAYKDGELVVDAVAGLADPATGRRVTSDTPFYAFSVGKTMTSTMAHQLVERGHVGYDTPVAEVWPEFGARGKGSVNLWHLLTHTAGIPGVPADTTVEGLCDWDGMCARIADSELMWTPGTQTAYHAYTFGYIVGEMVRRVTGKAIAQVLREDVAEPLGAADELFFGMPAAELGRLATLEDVEGSAEMLAAIPDDAPMFKLGPRAVWPNAEFGNRADVLQADLPAGGKVTARAVARVYAALLGQLSDVRLISPETAAKASSVAYEGRDAVFDFPTKWTLGFGAGGPTGESDTQFGWGGVGGSVAFSDATSGISYAVIKNRLSADFETSVKLGNLITGEPAVNQPSSAT